MSEPLAAPHLSHEDIRGRADGFLSDFHPQLAIPVPIEQIVEFRLGLDIVPVPGLHRALDIDGFTTSDLREIHVDQFIFEERPRRYRFTLAHEVGHIVLHKHIYSQRRFGSIEEWKAFVNSIPDREHSWLEYQAYAFGGLVLVPRDALLRETMSWVEEVRRQGLSFTTHWDFGWSVIEDQLAERFAVSRAVIDKRLDKDRIRERFRS